MISHVVMLPSVQPAGKQAMHQTAQRHGKNGCTRTGTGRMPGSAWARLHGESQHDGTATEPGCALAAGLSSLSGRTGSHGVLTTNAIPTAAGMQRCRKNQLQHAIRHPNQAAAQVAAIALMPRTVIQLFCDRAVWIQRLASRVVTTGSPEHKLRDDVEDDLSLVAGAILHCQQDSPNAHEGHCGDRAPLAANAVAQIADGDHATDDAHDLDVLRDLQAAAAATVCFSPCSGVGMVWVHTFGVARGNEQEQRQSCSTHLRQGLAAGLEVFVTVGVLSFQDRLDVANGEDVVGLRAKQRCA